MAAVGALTCQCNSSPSLVHRGDTCVLRMATLRMSKPIEEIWGSSAARPTNIREWLTSYAMNHQTKPDTVAMPT